MTYVIAYDVADDGRRNRVSRFLEGWGRRVQRSLFECQLSPEELKLVTGKLQEILDAKMDCCHVYRLCRDCAPKRKVIGNELEEPWPATLVV